MKIIKTCIKHGDLTEDRCRKSIEKRWGIQPNYKYKCLECIKLYNKKYLHVTDPEIKKIRLELKRIQHEKHRQKILATRRKWAKNNKEKLNKQGKSLRDKKKDHYREMGRNIQKKWREELNDNYVKEMVSSKYKIPMRSVPSWMIEVKREIIKLRRKIREIESGNK